MESKQTVTETKETVADTQQPVTDTRRYRCKESRERTLVLLTLSILLLILSDTHAKKAIEALWQKKMRAQEVQCARTCTLVVLTSNLV